MALKNSAGSRPHCVTVRVLLGSGSVRVDPVWSGLARVGVRKGKGWSKVRVKFGLTWFKIFGFLAFLLHHIAI